MPCGNCYRRGNDLSRRAFGLRGFVSKPGAGVGFNNKPMHWQEGGLLKGWCSENI